MRALGGRLKNLTCRRSGVSMFLAKTLAAAALPPTDDVDPDDSPLSDPPFPRPLILDDIDLDDLTIRAGGDNRFDAKLGSATGGGGDKERGPVDRNSRTMAATNTLPRPSSPQARVPSTRFTAHIQTFMPDIVRMTNARRRATAVRTEAISADAAARTIERDIEHRTGFARAQLEGEISTLGEKLSMANNFRELLQRQRAEPDATMSTAPIEITATYVPGTRLLETTENYIVQYTSRKDTLCDAERKLAEATQAAETKKAAAEKEESGVAGMQAELLGLMDFLRDMILGRSSIGRRVHRGEARRGSARGHTTGTVREGRRCVVRSDAPP